MKKYIVNTSGLTFSVNADFIKVCSTTGVTTLYCTEKSENELKADKDYIVAVAPHGASVFEDDKINKPEKSNIHTIHNNGQQGSKFHK